MTTEEKIVRIRKDSNRIERIRRDLIFNGFAPDSPEVKYMDDLLWKQIMRVYALTAGPEAVAKLYSELRGINLN